MSKHEQNSKAKRLIISAAIALASLGGTAQASAEKSSPVLMVISNQDFYHREYFETRESLEAAGLEVVVAAATTETARPHANARWGEVQPDIALTDVSAEDYSSVVFIGGWGSSQYQYDFPADYDNPAYEAGSFAAAEANRVIGDFMAEERTVAAICHGVSVLAWARVDGESPLAGRLVSGPAGGLPAMNFGRDRYEDAGLPARTFIEWNGARMVTSGSIGDPMTTEDDVVVDGNIITAENYDSAGAFGRTIARYASAR